MHQKGNFGHHSGSYQGESLYSPMRCRYCGNIIPTGEACYRMDGKPYCESCVESADLEDLIRICETETDELYRALGLKYEIVDFDRR